MSEGIRASKSLSVRMSVCRYARTGFGLAGTGRVRRAAYIDRRSRRVPRLLAFKQPQRKQHIQPGPRVIGF